MTARRPDLHLRLPEAVRARRGVPGEEARGPDDHRAPPPVLPPAASRPATGPSWQPRPRRQPTPRRRRPACRAGPSAYRRPWRRRRAGSASPPPRRRRRRPPRRRLPLGKSLSSSRASADGLRQPHAGAVQHLLRLRRVGQGRCQQRGRQPPVLLAGRLHEPPRVASVRCPDELTSRPSRRLVSGQRCTAYSSCTSRLYSARCQSQRAAWSRRPICFSASAWRRTFTPSRRSSRDQPPTISTASSKASASRRFPISESARSRSWVLRLRFRQVRRNWRRSSPVESKWSMALARRQLLEATALPRASPTPAARPRRGAPRRSARARARTPGRRAGSAVTGTTRRSTRSLRPRPRRTGPTTIAPPR